MAQEEIAQLGIEVDSTGVDKAKLSLDGLADAAVKTEAATSNLAKSSSEYARAQTQAMQSGVRREEAERSAAQRSQEAAEAIRRQGAELSKLVAEINPVIGALDRLDKQQEKLQNFRLAGAIDEDTFQDLSQRIGQSRSALGAFDENLNKTGATAKQTQQALRQLPAQFSDIFVSLQAGQSPLTVFLQQGAQIKDSFGGVGAALRETGKFAAGLVNPYTLAAAAAVALAVAYQQGSEEAVKFSKALILTGNAAGTTADELADTAAAVDGVIGTQAKAAEVIAQLAATGKIGADQFELLATAAISFEQATGQAIEKSIEQYVRLGDAPVDALLKLNEGTNFLTEAVLEQVIALQRQGNTAEATRVAQEALARSQIERSKEIVQELGYLETAWNAVTSAAAETWDAMLDAGREETPEKELKRLEEQLQRISQLGARRGRAQFGIGADQGDAEAIKARIAQLKQEDEQKKSSARDEGIATTERSKRLAALAAADKARTEAQKEFARIVENNLTKEQKLTAEIENIRKAGRTAGIDPAEVELQVQAAERAFAEANKRRPTRGAATPAVRDDAATRILLNLREQESALQLQLSTSDKLTSAERERAKFIQQIADLQSKDILTAEQKSLLSSQDSIKAQLDKNVAIEREIKLRDDALKLQDRIAQVQEAVRAGEIAREDQQADILGAAGLSQQEREIRESFDSIRKEYARYREELAKDLDKGALNSDEYAEAVNEIDKQLGIALEKQRKYFEELAAIEADATLGARKAVQDYIDESAKLGKQVNDLVGSSLGGLEDAFVELATTGKASFKDLADSIISDLIRIGTRLLISEALQVSGVSGGAGGGGANIAGLFTSIAGAFAGGGGGGGYTGAFGFEGGGFTGQGQRAGGVDGRGGFMAVLHPNETVIDHTKPNQSSMRSGGGSVSIGNIVLPGVTNAREAKKSGAEVARQINALVGGSARYA